MLTGAVWAAAAAGLAGGAALSMPAYRLSVPWRKAGEPPVPPKDSCHHCAAPLPAGWAGWLRLGGRCSHCRQRLGPHGWLLGAVCALACAGLAWQLGPTLRLVPYLVAVFLGVLIAAVDLASQRIPDSLVLPGVGAAVALFAGVAAATGEWADFGRALVAGLALLLGYAVLGMLPGANLGGGDVVLAGLLGVYLGWLGWPVAVAGALLPWLLQTPVALVALMTRRAGRDTMLPFGPAMLAGAYLAVVGLPVLTAFLAYRR